MSTPAIITDSGHAFATGWVYQPEEVARVVAEYGIKSFSEVSRVYAALYQANDDAPVFNWDAEKKVLGKILPSWNQGQVGSCVSFGYGRAAQDLMLIEIAAGQQEIWPDAEVATEPIYGGSRVEVGGGRINGDGSIGAWAAKWVKDWGILLRKRYQAAGQVFDLTTYSETRCRQYGQAGCPDPLEPEAKLHPVTEVAMVRTAQELWDAIGAGKTVPVCSLQGFTTTLVNGFCEPQGQWAHCMAFRGRFIHPSRGKCVIIQNSWGNYLPGSRSFQYVDTDGTTKTGTLPDGCFCTTLGVAASMCAQGDTFVLAGLKGWEPVNPTPPQPNPPTPPSPPVPDAFSSTPAPPRFRTLI
jgi:hypothetical protein